MQHHVRNISYSANIPSQALISTLALISIFMFYSTAKMVSLLSATFKLLAGISIGIDDSVDLNQMGFTGDRNNTVYKKQKTSRTCLSRV